ncbi:MAG: tripartite tricarboxylate transporter substrate-binding protein [Desulfobacterales bacterium]|nr:tripartite tricarboxylate transporter substrate-binding protein [Desulfobacterales bacterium]
MKQAKITKRLLFVLLAISWVFISLTAGYAEDAREFYNNKVLEIYCPYGVGGGFDVYARSLAQHISRFLPIKTAIVKNIKGAGGMTGTNSLYVAPTDGLTIGIINGGGMIFNQVMETPGVKYDLGKIEWLGRSDAEPHIIAVGKKSPFRSIKDLMEANRTVVFSATGKGSDDFLAAAVIADALGFKLRQVVGFGGTSETNLVVVKGDVDGTQSTVGSLLNLIDSGDVIPILQVALERDPRFKDVPLAIEIAPPDKKDIMTAITNTFEFGRAFCTPPGVSADRVKLLREAVWGVFSDKDIIQELEKRGRPVNAMKGEQMTALMQTCMTAAEKIKPVLKEAAK